MQWGPMCDAPCRLHASRSGQSLQQRALQSLLLSSPTQGVSLTWNHRDFERKRLTWQCHRRRKRSTMAPTLSLSASATTLTAPPATAPNLNKPPPSHIPITYSTAGSVSAAGHEFLTGLGKGINVSDQSTSSGALVLGMDGGSNTSLAETTVGQLTCRRFLASARIKIYWMSPEYGSTAGDLPPETQFLLLELAPKGPYAILLPLIDSGKFRATLRPPRKGDRAKDLRLRIESGDESVRASKWENALLCAAGHSPYDLVDSAVAAAAKISGTAKPRSAKQFPEFMKSFGWCTWDAFYSQVSAQGIAHGLDALREGGVPPKLLIIDDGWQSTQLDEPLRPITETGAVKSENKVLMAASKRTTFSGGSPMAQLANQAAVLENGDSDVIETPVRVTPEHGPVKAAWERFKGYMAGLVAALITTLYTWLVEHAPTGSWRISWFARLSEDKLRKTILAFYAQTSDHVKRLASPLANGKFSSSSAGPDTPWGRPEALRTVVTDLKERFHLKHVFCWHSLYGYWAGIDPASPEMQQYGPSLVWPKPTGGVVDVDPPFAWNCQVVAGAGVVEDVQQLYSDMHSYLAGCGVDGVKVDCQSTLDMIGSSLGGGSAYSAKFHNVLENSVKQHFPGNALINCMCHSTNDLYRMTDTALARSSDDFWPRDVASHTTHVAINAGNSVFMAALVQPDWDMFQSQHPAAVLHASARVVSGGPVYVSDRPGKHNMELLKRMVLPDGNVLLCTQPGRPTLDCLFADCMRDRQTLLKVWNTNREGSGVVGIFNVQGSHWSRRNRMFVMHDSRPQLLTTLVSPSDVMAFGGEDPSARYVLYSDARKAAWVTELREGVKVSLKRAESDLITIVPLRQLKGLSLAPIGLVNMLNTGGAVESFACEAPSTGAASCTITVNGCGSLAVYSTVAPSSCVVEGMSVSAQYCAESKLLTLPVPQTADLQATVEISFAQ